MKGIVFTEFTEMVEEKFGLEMMDELISNSDLPSKGVYTAVGTYDDSEIVQLVVALHQKTEIPVPTLIHTFGKYLFGSFVKKYPVFFEHVNDGFTLLKSVPEYIHIEVKKLYTDANLPEISCEQTSDNQLKMDYQSPRKMGDLALGLIEAAGEHFGENYTIERNSLPPNDGTHEEFIITRS